MYDVNDLRFAYAPTAFGIDHQPQNSWIFICGVPITKFHLCSTLTTRERVQIHAAGVNG